MTSEINTLASAYQFFSIASPEWFDLLVDLIIIQRQYTHALPWFPHQGFLWALLNVSIVSGEGNAMGLSLFTG
ncbi:MAG: hypothetical protein WBA57_27020 [Elainellaceae cyanobacterium]